MLVLQHLKLTLQTHSLICVCFVLCISRLKRCGWSFYELDSLFLSCPELAEIKVIWPDRTPKATVEDAPGLLIEAHKFKRPPFSDLRLYSLASRNHAFESPCTRENGFLALSGCSGLSYRNFLKRYRVQGFLPLGAGFECGL